MDEEYFMKDVADDAITNISEFIEIEGKLINKEHKLEDSIGNIEQIYVHLVEERIYDEELSALSGKIQDRLEEIKELIESNVLKDLEFKKEEADILEKLKEDLEHKDWKAVKKDLVEEAAEEKKVLRLEKKELRQLHSAFVKLLKVMKKCLKLLKLKADTSAGDHEGKMEYYLLYIYHFARFYERVFHKLWKKERELFRKVKKASKKIKD